MSQPPFVPGQVHTEEEFDNGPDADLAMQQDPNWDVPNTPPQTFQTDTHPNPLATAEEASRIAGAALHFADQNHIDLNGKKYLKIEAWTAIAFIAGTPAAIEPPVKDNVLGGVAGITARSSLKNAAGKILGQAEGFVGNDEPFWATKPVSDRVNMAQTRAVGRVCRLVYSFIVQIMNKEYGRSYEVTPAEEMLASQHAAPQMAPQAPQPGVRHVFQPQQWPAQTPPPYHGPTDPNWNVGQGPATGFVQDPSGQMRQAPQPNVVYPDSHAFVPGANQAAPVGQNELWQGTLGNVQIKMVPSKRGGQSQLFLIYLTDGRNASTFDKTIAGHAGQLIGHSIEMLVIPRGQGRYNVGQLRPI